MLLVTDGHLAYRAFAREAGIAHAFVNLRMSERVRGAVHVQKHLARLTELTPAR